METINSMKTNREFFLSFARDPQLFINKWLISQSKGKKRKHFQLRKKIYFIQWAFFFVLDLKTMTDVVGSPEEERRTDFYYQPWAQEAVCRYELFT